LNYSNTQYVLKPCEAKIENFKPVTVKSFPGYWQYYREYELTDDKIKEKVFFDLSGMRGEKRAVKLKIEKEWMRKHKTDKLNMHHNSADPRNKKVEQIMEQKYGKELASYIDCKKSTRYDKRLTIYNLLIGYQNKKEGDRLMKQHRKTQRYLLKKQEEEDNKKRDEMNFHIWYQNMRNSNAREDRGNYASSGLGGKYDPDLKSQIRKISDGDIKYTKKPESTNTEKYRRQEYAEKTRATQRVKPGSNNPEHILNDEFGEHWET
jgi:hypothetical protein